MINVIKRGQASFEFLMISGALFLILIIFLGINSQKQSEINKVQEKVDMRNECIRLSNIVSNVYTSGHGTEVNTKTKYLITIYNSSLMSIRQYGDAEYAKNNIAVLISESGVSTQNFYDRANNKLSPDFFKWCSDDWYGCLGMIPSGCPLYTDRFLTDCHPDPLNDGKTVNWDNTPKNLSDLVDNLDKYDTVYLEDPHLHPLQIYNGPNIKYQGMEYPSIFQNWTHDGGVFITSEHFFCIGNGGAYSDELSNHWNCKNTEMFLNMGNMKIFFGRHLYMYSGVYINPGRPLKIVNKTDPYTFNIGDTYGFSEPSCIKTYSLEGDEDVISKYENNLGSYNCSDLNDPSSNFGDPTILMFRYGSGMVHYIADFEVTGNQDQFSNNLVNLIEKTYYLVAKKEYSVEEFCNFYGKSNFELFTGNITIVNNGTRLEYTMVG